MTPLLWCQASPSLGWTGDAILGKEKGEKKNLNALDSYIVLKQLFFNNQSCSGLASFFSSMSTTY